MALELKKFVDTKAEGDKRGRGSNPRHHRSFIRGARARKSELRRDIDFRAAVCVRLRHSLMSLQFRINRRPGSFSRQPYLHFAIESLQIKSGR